MGGKTRGAVRVCLELLAPPFLSREKVGKDRTEKLLEKVRDRTSRCRIKSGMTARGSVIANSLKVKVSQMPPASAGQECEDER